MTALPELPGPPGVPAGAPRLVVRGPDCLPVVVPHLLGFHPDDSVVLLGLEPGSHHVRVTLRLDLPDAADDGSGWDALVPAFARAGASEVLVAVYPPAAQDPWRHGGARPLPRPDVVAAAADALEAAGVRALDAVCVVGDRLRSYWCVDEQCCPREGRRLDPAEVLRIEAEFVATRSAPLASRRSLEERLAPRPDDDPFLLEVADEVCARAGDLATYGSDDIDAFLLGLAIHAAGTGQPNPTATLVGWASSLAAWVRPRDLLMRALSVGADPTVVRSAREVLIEAVRCAPGTEVAPVASLLAICSWLGGDGALARVALERAQAADPGYSLAALLSDALDAGLPPWSWSSMMAEISVERILQTGDGPPRRLPIGPLPRGVRARGVGPADDGDEDDEDAELAELGLLDDLEDETWDLCDDPACAACACARATAGTDEPGDEPDRSV